jgi:hypothetical protein
MTDKTLFDDSINENNYDLVNGDISQKNYLESLVGEGKKFADANALAYGKMQSDMFIQRLLNEKRAVEAELAKRQSTEDLIKSLKGNQGDPPPPNHGGERRTEEVTGIDPENIQRIVQDALATREQETQKVRNLQEVTTALRNKFGQNYAAELEKKAEEIGVGKNFLDDLAKTNPKAFLKLVDVDTAPAVPESVFSPPASRIAPVVAPQSQGKTYSYYEKIRKTDPKLYSTLQKEMFDNAVRLGDDFYK